MTIDLTENLTGVQIAVRAQPGSSKNRIIGVHAGHLKVAVTQIAENGKANKAILKFLAQELGVSRSQLHIVSGELSANKRIQVDGVSRSTLLNTLQSITQPEP